MLLPLPASCDTALGALLWPAFSRGAAVREGERAGGGRRRARVQALGRKWGIPVITLSRWRQWWRETFAQTRAWRWKRGGVNA